MPLYLVRDEGERNWSNGKKENSSIVDCPEPTKGKSTWLNREVGSVLRFSATAHMKVLPSLYSGAVPCCRRVSTSPGRQQKTKPREAQKCWNGRSQWLQDKSWNSGTLQKLAVWASGTEGYVPYLVGRLCFISMLGFCFKEFPIWWEAIFIR